MTGHSRGWLDAPARSRTKVKDTLYGRPAGTRASDALADPHPFIYFDTLGRISAFESAGESTYRASPAVEPMTAVGRQESVVTHYGELW